MTDKKLAFFYTHYQCLGHTARILSLLSAIKGAYPSSKLFNIHGSYPHQELIPPTYIKNLYLPHPLFSSANFREPFRIPFEHLQERAEYLLGLIKQIEPDIFLTEYFPFGRNVCKYELLPSFSYLRRKNATILSSVGYPLVSENGFEDIYNFSIFLKHIFIHSPYLETTYIADSYGKSKEKQKYLEIFRRFSEKITFTNYVLPVSLKFGSLGQKNYTPLIKKGKINVLVTRGAGAYYPNIILAAIKASELFDDNFNFIIISGPSTPESDFSIFCVLMKKKKVSNASLLKYTSNLSELMKKCDLCISTAAYNTAVSLLYYRKSAIIIPFEGYGRMHFREQPARARLLNDYLGGVILRYTNLTAKKLAQKIIKKVNQSASSLAGKIEQNWFSGREEFIQGLMRFSD